MMEKHISSISKGMVVADVGAGIGYLSFKLSKAVGKGGRVYAVDIDKSVLDFVDRVKGKEGMTNIQTVLSKPADISVPDSSCDEIYLLGTLHAITPVHIIEEFVESCHRSLKPGGLLLALDRWHDFRQLSGALRAINARFKLVQEEKSMPHNSSVKIFRKD